MGFSSDEARVLAMRDYWRERGRVFVIGHERTSNGSVISVPEHTRRWPKRKNR